MRARYMLPAVLLAASFAPQLFAAKSLEKIRNEKVVVTEETLQPGEAEAQPPVQPSMIVYMTDGTAAHRDGSSGPASVKAGQTVFEDTAAGPLRNSGEAPLHFCRISFLTEGKDEMWGTTGLSPNYVLLLENRYGRAYDIRIPAHAREPQHTHHDRVVISLSGAQLEHILPTGKIQPSTLKTGEIVWRLGGTHIGHNLGDTNLWVIAVEPK